MLKEAFLVLDEPRTLNEVKLRKAYLMLLGREPELSGFTYWIGDLANGASFSNVVNNIALSAERQQYLQQANGNPVVTLIPRDGDGIIESGEAAFNTQLNRFNNLFYTVTGDIISLPYEHSIYMQNKLASSNVNINPYGVAAFIGAMTLNPPENSVEFSNKSAPTVFDDPNDNYSTVVNSFKNELGSKEGVTVNVDDATGFYGSYYGEWELISQGSPELDPSDNTYKRVDTYGRYKYDFSIKPVGQTSGSSGQRRDIVYDQNLRPKMSDVTIGFSAVGLKPSTRVYAFFGDRAVSDACTMFTQSAGGHDIISTTLQTDNEGKIRGTFTYRESDLNFDAGIYPFALTDSTTNSDNRTTYASSLFNGLGLAGYGEDTFRTRIAQQSLNKTSSVVTSQNRTVVTGTVETPVTTAKTIDIIDFCFVYALGRKPSQEEKVGIYNKWVDYGIADMTVWNSIETANTYTGAATNGNEIWSPWGWPRNDTVLSYVDRAITTVANGTDSADLRSKYVAAATYPYGTWNWIYVKDEPQFPATVNYLQFMNQADPGASLTPPWTTDLQYSSLNAAGVKVLTALRNLIFDVIALNNGIKPADYQGTIGFAARYYGIIAYDNDGNLVEGTSKLPTVYRLAKTPKEWNSNVHDITTVWNTIGTDCQQPHKLVAAASPYGTPMSTLQLAVSRDVVTNASYLTVDTGTGGLAGVDGGSGNGPAVFISQVEYPATLVPGAVYQTATSGTIQYTQAYGGGANAWNWHFSGSTVEQPYSATASVMKIGVLTGNPKLTGQPYQFMGMHYGNYTWQIAIGIQSGQTGNTVNVPVKLVVQETGATFDTWIPGTSASYWDDGSNETNFVDIYTGYKGADPLGLNSIHDGRQITLLILPRDAAATPATPVGGSSGGYIADAGIASIQDALQQAG